MVGDTDAFTRFPVSLLPYPVASERYENPNSSLLSLNFPLACSNSMLVTQIYALSQWMSHVVFGTLHPSQFCPDFTEHPTSEMIRNRDMASVNRPHPRLSRPI